MEDFNYLLKREQVELLHASSAVCADSRSIHLEMAKRYARRIADHPYRTPNAARTGAFA